MNDFAQFLRASGLAPGVIAADGKVRRCPTTDHPKRRNGAYYLSVDGRMGWAQNWATDSEPAIWRAEQETVAAAPIDVAAIRRRTAAQRVKREKASEAARQFYAQCAPLIGGHDYLTSKGLDLTGCRGLRVDRDGWLVVPMLRGTTITSLQRIARDGDKRFWPGAITTATHYPVERRGAALTVLCEGLATGLAIYAAVPTCKVVVAFTASNLPKVAALLPRRGLVSIAADNDHETAAKIGRNPGVDAAQEAARVLGCGVAIPEGMEGSDWLDYRNERLQQRTAPVYGKRRESEANVRRAIDAEIARAVMRHATYLAAA